MVDIAPIERRRIYEEIVERVEEMLASGALKPGDQLPSERVFMKMFGVGRTSIREALFALQRRGVVNVQMGGRTTITEPTASVLVSELTGAVRYYLSTDEGIRDFQAARRLFEAALARHAAEVATDEDVAELGARLEENRAALGDLEAFAKTDVTFHFAIAKIARSQLFNSLHRALLEWLSGQRLASAALHESTHAAYKAHATIFTAIANHDPSAAAFAMQEHLDEVAEYYWKARTASRKDE